MNHNYRYSALTLAVLGLFSAFRAGNPERVGQAGASQLLINPYTRNAGMVGSNSARIRGLEAQFMNVAGTAFTRKTEAMFNRTNWLPGTDIHINTFGLTQGIGEVSTIGFGVVAIDAGKLDYTTEDQPEGGLGTFNPSFYNISLSFARIFSNFIYGGFNVKILSEQVPGASARGIAIDAGIQYHSGKYDQIHIGIALKNWGPKMFYAGDGLSRQITVAAINDVYQITMNNRSASYELPALVNIGLSYDFFLTKDSVGLSKKHRLSLNGTYTSNSFTYDNGLFGVEYAWKEMLMVRGGMYVENNIFNKDVRRTALTGPAVGLTFEFPFTEKRSTIGVDYAYRTSFPFGGIHSFGVRLNL
jgi:hypothetical protein